ASVYSRYAKRREDVGLATLLGFLGVLSLMVVVTMLSYGILTRRELMALPTPSLAGVFAAIVGPWGAVFIGIGLLISVLGNYVSWSLLAAEVAYSAARNDLMPKFMARENARKVPAGALWTTSIVIQFFLLVSYFAEYAFFLALKMTSAMTLVPYFLIAAYGLKLAHTGQTYDVRSAGRSVDWVRSAVATLYTAMMLLAGPRYLLLSAVIYALGTLLYWKVRRERGQQIFTGVERYVCAVIVAGCVAGVWALMTGAIRL
ncbi:MAG TPA: amino acid permease, partial [Povalibacter sp.]|nr:amino acid permease [Povalibacter sp.]